MQRGEIQDNLKLEMTAKRLLPRGYGDDDGAAVLDQLKAWETFHTLGVGWRENPPMPTGDITPPECPRTRCHSQASGNFSGRPVMTARVAETTCRSQATSSETVTADCKLQQQPVIQLPKLGGEKLNSIFSKGSTRQPRTSTPVESAHLRPPENESMEVDTPAVQAASQNSSASVATRSATQGASASQTHPKLTGSCSRPNLKTKQHTKTPQGVRNIVAGVLESRDVSQEDWEQSLWTD